MTYDWRTTPCECDGGTSYATDRDGYYDQRCEICEGAGELDAQCCECMAVKPLDEDGVCESCAVMILGLSVEEIGPNHARLAA